MAQKGIELLQALASRLSYKPGCHFGVDAPSPNRALLWLAAPSLSDARRAGSFGLRIFHDVQPATIHTTADALQAFAVLVSRFELHEAAEFFCVDSRQVFMPHRAGAEHGTFVWCDFESTSGRWIRAMAEWLDNDQQPGSEPAQSLLPREESPFGIVLVQPPSSVALTSPGQAPFTGAHFAQQDLVRGLISAAGPGEVLIHAIGRERSSWAAALSRDEFAQRAVTVDLDGLRRRLASRAPTVLLVPHADLTPALHIRHVLGGPRWPVVGLTHDLSDPAIFRSLVLAQSAGLRAGDALVCCSRAARDAAIRLSAQARQLVASPEEALSFPVVAHGVDASLHEPGDRHQARQRFGLAEDVCVFLCFGRIDHGSKADLVGLIGAFGQSPFSRRAHLLIAGASVGNDAGRQLDMLRRAAQAAAPEGSVSFLPNPDVAAKQRLFAAADVFVSPAHSLQESFGLTLIEAMLHGLPLVATDWNGYRDIVEDGRTGLLVPTRFVDAPADAWFEAALGPRSEFHAAHTAFVHIDIEALADAMARLASNPALRASMGANGRRRALERFDVRVTVLEHRAVFADSLRRAAGAADRQSGSPLPDLREAFAGHPARTPPGRN